MLDFTNSSDESCFKEIAEFALSLLAMPLSNADVERMFWHMNLVKSCHRNRMKNPMLERHPAHTQSQVSSCLLPRLSTDRKNAVNVMSSDASPHHMRVMQSSITLRHKKLC